MRFFNLRVRSVDRVNNTGIGEDKYFPQHLLEPLPRHPAWSIRLPIPGPEVGPKNSLVFHFQKSSDLFG
jgi:hypothetical protein